MISNNNRPVNAHRCAGSWRHYDNRAGGPRQTGGGGGGVVSSQLQQLR